MFVSLVMSSALLGLSLAQGLIPTPSTSDATITPAPDHLELLRRENNDRYMGWVSYDGTWYSQQCDLGGTYFQTSDYWRCCTTTANGCARTNMPIGCISGSLIYSMTVSTLSQTLFTYACTSIFTGSTAKSFTICNTLFMFENEGDSSPLTNVNCGAQSLRWSYYRVAPYAATAVSSLELSSSPTGRSTPATSTASVTATPTPTPIPEPSKSKAWIAGAVVGPIVGLALIGFAAFLFLRHKKKKQNQSHPAVGGAPPHASPQVHSPGPHSPPQYYAPMAQNNGAPGMVPYGVAKHDSWVPPPQSPNTHGSMSPDPHGYGAPPPHGWQQDHNNLHMNQTPPLAGQPGYGPPSPSMSPSPGHVQPAPYNADTGTFKHTGETVRPFSSELEGSHVHSQPMPAAHAPAAPTN